MTDEEKTSIKTDLQATFPELFDDETATNKLDMLIKQAELKCRSYQVDDNDLKLLITLYVAHLLRDAQQSDGVATSVKADVFQVNLSDTAGTDIYLEQFNDMLTSLGLDNRWKVQFL